jgi:DNA-binding response OmpR family regulator
MRIFILAEQILIVEDEPDIVETVRYNLERTGFHVVVSEDAEMALNLVAQHVPDLIVLDLMLPGMDGFDFCKALKQEPKTRNVPICVLTACRKEVDRILAFELGVDDYVEKPFSPRELVLRIRSILRRSKRAQVQAEDHLEYGILTVDKAGHKVFVRGIECDLTPIEFQLLVILMARSGRVQTREDLLDAVWGYGNVGNGRMVDAHIRRMRAKLDEAQNLIRTVRGVGYCFKPDPRIWTDV